jgi:hypothetical protein
LPAFIRSGVSGSELGAELDEVGAYPLLQLEGAREAVETRYDDCAGAAGHHFAECGGEAGTVDYVRGTGATFVAYDVDEPDAVLPGPEPDGGLLHLEAESLFGLAVGRHAEVGDGGSGLARHNTDHAQRV